MPHNRPGRAASKKMKRRRLRAAFMAIVVATVVTVLVRHDPAGAARRSGNASRRLASGSSGGRAVNEDDFSPGACLSFRPTDGNRHLTVFLDAGHGGLDPGAIGTTESGQQIEEANLTLPVEMEAATLLRHAGFTVVVSRTGDTNVVRLSPADVSEGDLSEQGAHDDVAARDECANDAQADLLVGIYFDSGATASNAGSVTGYDAARPFSAANLRFANLLQSDVLAAMNYLGWGIPDEGVVNDVNLGSAYSSAAVSYGHLMLLGPAQAEFFNTPSLMPGALIEPLFITDPFEASIADSTLGQEVIGAGIATAVEQYFAPPPTPVPSTT